MRLTFGNKTNNHEVAELDSFLMEKKEMTDVQLFLDIWKASSGLPDLANWPNHCAEINCACMQHAILN